MSKFELVSNFGYGSIFKKTKKWYSKVTVLRKKELFNADLFSIFLGSRETFEKRKSGFIDYFKGRNFRGQKLWPLFAKVSAGIYNMYTHN